MCNYTVSLRIILTSVILITKIYFSFFHIDDISFIICHISTVHVNANVFFLVFGRSIVVHTKDRQAPRMACADIFPVSSEMSSVVVFEIPAEQFDK